jgi:hypothetical protein
MKPPRHQDTSNNMITEPQNTAAPRQGSRTDAVARTIFKAATDKSGRLRYSGNARVLLTLHAILPDAIWRALIGATLKGRSTRRAKG